MKKIIKFSLFFTLFLSVANIAFGQTQKNPEESPQRIFFKYIYSDTGDQYSVYFVGKGITHKSYEGCTRYSGVGRIEIGVQGERSMETPGPIDVCRGELYFYKTKIKLEKL